MQLGDPPRGSLTSGGGLMSHPPPPPYFHHPKDFKRITISKEDIVQVFNEGNASEGGENSGNAYASVSPHFPEHGGIHSPTGLSMIAAAPSVADIAAEAAAAGPIVETTHPQLTDGTSRAEEKVFKVGHCNGKAKRSYINV